LSKPEKAYRNIDFLTSPDARLIRVMCEFVEPKSRFRKYRVRDTIVFFGSARTLAPEVAAERLAQVEAELDDTLPVDPVLAQRLAIARRDLDNSRYYGHATELSKRLTEWSMSLRNKGYHFVVCSGGGPGIMEAANRGARQGGGKSVSLNISLPFEQVGNPYQTPELAFEFHYFFVRKFWFVYLAKALIVFPGGFGTMDELFEVLTLVQTHKSAKDMPIVLFGREFWERVFNFDVLVELGYICPNDLNLFKFCDTVEEAYEYLTGRLTELYLDEHPEPGAT
jgi:uncharacterized protein (TIGR00730 family)